jgi:hypothetical protein
MVELNTKAEVLFDHMKDINNILNKKTVKIEDSVTRSEEIFIEELTTLMNQKKLIRRYAIEETI